MVERQASSRARPSGRVIAARAYQGGACSAYPRRVLVCANAEFIPWRPDFSSSQQASPYWTKLICGAEQLSNSIDAVDWFDDPAVQVELCESCGLAGCASGGYVHVSRLGRHLLWTPPHVDLNDPFESYQYRPSKPLRRYGGIAIPLDEWERWRRQFVNLPPADAFAQAARRDLLAAWRGEAQIFREFDDPTRLVQLVRERAVAADPSSVDQALADVEAIADWLTAAPDTPVKGELVSLLGEEAVVETIYLDVPDTFDRPHLREWSGAARIAGKVSPVFGGQLVLAPAPA